MSCCQWDGLLTETRAVNRDFRSEYEYEFVHNYHFSNPCSHALNNNKLLLPYYMKFPQHFNFRNFRKKREIKMSQKKSVVKIGCRKN